MQAEPEVPTVGQAGSPLGVDFRLLGRASFLLEGQGVQVAHVPQRPG